MKGDSKRNASKLERKVKYYSTLSVLAYMISRCMRCLRSPDCEVEGGGILLGILEPNARPNSPLGPMFLICICNRFSLLCN